MRSRIFFVVACGLIFGPAWFGLSDAFAQTPLRPDSPAVASEEIPLRPNAAPAVPSEKVVTDGVQQVVQDAVKPAAVPAAEPAIEPAEVPGPAVVPPIATPQKLSLIHI